MDVYALDTESMVWECIMDGSENGLSGDAAIPGGAGGMPSLSGGAADLAHVMVRHTPRSFPFSSSLVTIDWKPYTYGWCTTPYAPHS